MFRMAGIQRTQFKLRAITGERGPHPAAGTAGFEDVSRGRKIHQMHAGLVLADMPVVGVAVDVSFHVAVTGEDFFKCG